jgi:hypothetical protein
MMIPLNCYIALKYGYYIVREIWKFEKFIISICFRYIIKCLKFTASH